MPAVQEILSTINQFALARLPVGSWRPASFEAGRWSLTGRTVVAAAPEEPDVPESEYAHAGAEPPLDEMLCDPVVQLVMEADRVQPGEVRRLRGAVRRRSHAAPIDPGAICPQ